MCEPCILQKANDEMVLLVFDELESFSDGFAQHFKELDTLQNNM